MSKAASQKSEIKIGESANLAELVNVSDWSMNTTRNTIDVSTIGTEWKEYLVGQITATGSFNLIYDSTDTAAQSVAAKIRAGETLKIHVYPLGSEATKPEIVFDALPTSWNLSAATEAAITIAVDFQVTGEVTETTVQ
ncbi:MAG: hypothetical protein IJS40_00645 [Synergistaceae bacterium]|nr:hypothetical protein [Synergistaceae bacterium]